ncbi:glycosyl hydrolase family 28-related protein [Escherichia coli]|nr:hypothetical protein [Escherichia coli]EER5417599.1 hypothetical protein [Escherichia coli]EET3797629.1 hypothetical protein [Escherichia coli]EFK9327500.1 hypothetical protein [Escherichia coli]EGA9701012.1 hypothetical protein [Escherichia coli]
MTVSTEVNHNEYTGNGVTTTFPYTFRVFNKSDLVVQVIDLAENIAVLSPDTDYTVTGTGGYNGGNVILSKALANGYQISISRELKVTQETDLRNHGKFFAEVHEDALDKLTMLIQQVGSMFRLALRKPSSIANWYDALNNYIRNLKDPRDPQDAATKNYVDTLASSNFNRTLRVPEPINQLPNVAGRRNMMPAFDNEGNAIVVVPPSGSASDVLIQLASTADGKGDALIAVKQPFAGAVARTQHDKNKDVINVKDFGAIGDGNDHPLSEIFSTLSVAQIVYPFVTSLTQSQDYAAIQSAINAAKTINAAVFLPSGQYVVNSTISADYAVSMYGEGGQGLRDVSSTHGPSSVRGTVIMSKVASGRTLSVSPAKYCFGLTLRDFAIWGVNGQCDVGLYLNSVGWMGIVEGVNIQFFPNQALEIGYIQDTYFTNCSFLQSGNVDNPAVTMIRQSNYVYFTGCHFELTPYMIKFGDPWFVFFNHCHFEVARPVGDGITDDDRFYYISSPIDLGASREVFFSNNVFIPTDVAYLASKLGVSRRDVPYFITGSGSIMSFTGDIFMAPEGTIKSVYLSGEDISFNGVKFIRCDPSNYGLFVHRGKVVNCSYGVDATADSTNLWGIYVGSGPVTGNIIGLYESDSNGKRTSGALITGGAHCSNNELPVDSRVNIYLDAGATVNGFDGGKPFFVDITAGGDVDLTKIHPAANLRITGAAVSIYHIYGAPYGRDLLIASNTTDGVVKFAANNIIPKGSVDFTIPQYHHTLWRCIDDSHATMYQIS